MSSDRRRLRLAAAGGTSVGSAGTCGTGVAISKRMCTLAEASLSLTNRRNLLILHLHERRSSPAAALGHRLLIGGDVESDEEEEVGRDDEDARDGGELLAGALASVGEPGPVGAGEVGPRGEVDEA